MMIRWDDAPDMMDKIVFKIFLNDEAIKKKIWLICVCNLNL